MRLRNTSYIVWGNLTERKTRTLAAVMVIAFAVAVVLAVASLSLGFLREVSRKAEEAFPPGMLLVKPRTMNLAMLSFNTGTITDDTVASVTQMRGVEFVARQLSMKMPLRAEGEVMGQSAETDAIVVGIDPEMVKDDVMQGLSFSSDANSSEPVPCILPRFFLDMYNLAYADSMGLPKINENFARGKTFKLHLGETYLLGDAGNDSSRKKTVECRIVGLTSNPSLLSGLLLPLEYAREFNKWYTKQETQNYSALHVKVSDLSHLDEVTSRIQDLGLISQSNNDELEKIHAMVGSITWLSALFAGVVVAIALGSVLNTFSLIMAQRRGEVGVLRAVGGSRKVVTRIFLLEIAVISFGGALCGALSAVLVLKGFEGRILSLLPRLSVLPEKVFYTPAHLVLGLILVSGIACLITALPIIMGTTRVAPALLVSEN